MRRSLLGLVLVACAPASSSSAGSEADFIGGKEAGRRFPASAMLSLGLGDCGGAKIGERRFLTAAHCVTQTFLAPGRSIRIDYGVPRRQVFTKLKAEVHSNFVDGVTADTASEMSDASGLDVAVLDVADDTPGLAIATIDRTPQVAGDTVVISGYGCEGDRFTDGGTGVGELHFGKVRLESLEKYHYYLPRFDVDGVEARVCPGDSGTPVYKDTGETFTTIVGINSFRSVPKIWGAAARLDRNVPKDAEDWLLGTSGLFPTN